LGDKNSDVCVLDQAGEVNQEFRLRMKEADVRAYSGPQSLDQAIS